MSVFEIETKVFFAIQRAGGSFTVLMKRGGLVLLFLTLPLYLRKFFGPEVSCISVPHLQQPGYRSSANDLRVQAACVSLVACHHDNACNHRGQYGQCFKEINARGVFRDIHLSNRTLPRTE